MNWQLLVSLRYLTSKRKEKFISLIGLISVLGVAIGVGALIIVIGVMSGFDEDLENKIVGTYSHIEILSDYGMKPSADLTGSILNTPNVKAASYFLNGQGLIRVGDNVTGVLVKGITPQTEIRVNSLGEYLKHGSLDLAGGGAVIGSELASKLGVKVGDAVALISPTALEPKGSVSPSEYRVAGIFTSGMYEYDMNLVYIDIAEAQKLFGLDSVVSGASIKVDRALDVDRTRKDLQLKLGPQYAVRTWMDLNRNLIAALKLEKTVMFIILTLVVIVACFNIASSLIMTVLEKTRDIGILKAIGATRLNVMAVFAIQGGLTGILGTLLGASAGIIICWSLKTYKFIDLPKEIYYIDKLPVKIDPYDILLIVVTSILISLVAAIYPSFRASRLDPVEALRYE